MCRRGALDTSRDAVGLFINISNAGRAAGLSCYNNEITIRADGKQGFRTCRTVAVHGICRQCHSSQNTDDGDHNHQLDESEAVLGVALTQLAPPPTR